MSQDALTSTVILLQVARSINMAHQLKQWKPRRGIKIVSWGGADIGNIGMLQYIKVWHLSVSVWCLSVCSVCQCVVSVSVWCLSVCSICQFVVSVSVWCLSLCVVSVCGICQCVASGTVWHLSVCGVCQCAVSVCQCVIVGPLLGFSPPGQLCGTYFSDVSCVGHISVMSAVWGIFQ